MQKKKKKGKGQQSYEKQMLSLMQKILMAALQSFLTPQTALMQILQRQKHKTHWPYV